MIFLDYFDLGRKLEQLKSECKAQKDMEKYVNVLEKINFKKRHAYKVIQLYKIMDSAPLVVKKYNWS